MSRSCGLRNCLERRREALGGHMKTVGEKMMWPILVLLDCQLLSSNHHTILCWESMSYRMRLVVESSLECSFLL